jgi:glycosyltransferase involved in cell wall biosynthesis
VSVLFLLNGYERRGAEMDILRLTGELRRRGRRVGVVLASPLLAGEMQASGAEVRVLPIGRAAPWSLARAVAGLVRLARLREVEVFAPQGARSTLLAGIAARLVPVRRARRPRVIAMVHNIRDRSNDRPAVRIYRAFADALVVVSRFERDRLVRRGLPRGRAIVVPSGIPEGPFLTPERPDPPLPVAPADDPIVITVARFTPEKGIVDLIRAAELVLRRARRARFLVVGDGPYRREVHRAAAPLVGTGRLVLLGERRDVPSILAHAASDPARPAIFCLPSLRESLPVSIREAMAAGLPVVATAAGGVGEAVLHGATGLIVPPGAPLALAEAILALARDPARRARLGAAGRARFRARFRLEPWVDRLESLMFGPPGSSPWRSPSSASATSVA